MIYIEAPNRDFVKNRKSLFLAGGITDCPDWQQTVVDGLKDSDIIVFNPRRKNFPIDDPNAAKAQITWEYDMLRQADIIVYWFCSTSIQPIVLFELGSHLMTDKPIVIGIDPKYSRKQDVEIQTKLERPDVKIVYSLKDFIKSIQDKVNGMKHLAIIQSEFLKQARDWDDLTNVEQRAYIKRHPKTKRRLTGQLNIHTTLKPRDYTIEYGPVRDIGSRMDENDIIINRNNQSYKVGVFKMYTGREQDVKTIKWNHDQLKQLLPTINLDKYEDSSIRSGQDYEWDPLDILENDLRQ